LKSQDREPTFLHPFRNPVQELEMHRSPVKGVGVTEDRRGPWRTERRHEHGFEPAGGPFEVEGSRLHRSGYPAG
jgi:hypothetical protein